MLRRAARRLGVLLLGAGVLGLAFVLALLLINAAGAAGLFMVVVTLGLGAAVGWAAIRWAEPRIAERAFAIVTTVVGFVAASIALSITLATTSWEWQAYTRTLPHPGRSLISFALFGIVFLGIGIPRVRKLHEDGRILPRPDAPERAPIRPGRTDPGGGRYRAR